MAFSLKAVLGLETTKFERGIDRARKKLNASVKGMLTSLGPLLGFVGFSSMANSALNLAREITNLSKVANANAEQFQRNAFAAKTVGVEQEKLADIYKDAGDKIGDFLQTGAGPMADFFENIAPKIGVTADQFRNLSGPDALQLYYDSINKANLSQSEMTFYMEAIASDATKLIPLLKDGGKGFADLGKKAEEAGLVMGDLEREKLEKINLKMDVWKKKSTILGGELLTKVIPALKILGQGLGFVGDIIGVVAANFVAWGKTMNRVISAIVAPAISQIEALGLAIKAAGQFAMRDFGGAKESIKAAKDEVVGIVDEVKAIPGEMEAAAEDLANSITSGTEVLGESVDERSKRINAALEDIKGTANETEDALGDALTGGSGGGGSGGGGSGETGDTGGREGETEGTGGGGSGETGGTGDGGSGETGGTGDGGSGETGGTGDGERELDKKLQKMKLAQLKAEVRGEEELAAAMKKRIELAEKILQIMRETGATQKEATIIANSQMSSAGRTSPGTRKAGGGGGDGDGTMRGKIRTGRIGDGMASMPSMEERERAAGLYLGGNDPLAGRRGPADVSGGSIRPGGDTGKKEAKTANEYLAQMSGDMHKVANEMTRED